MILITINLVYMLINFYGGENMQNNRNNNAKVFRNSQRRIPYKIEHSFSGSREHYSDGTVRNCRTIWQIR